MKCARCGRRLTLDPVILAGLELGPTCARIVAGAAADIPRRPTRAARVQAKREQEFHAAQLPIFEETTV